MKFRYVKFRFDTNPHFFYHERKQLCGISGCTKNWAVGLIVHHSGLSENEMVTEACAHVQQMTEKCHWISTGSKMRIDSDNGKRHIDCIDFVVI